MTRPKLGLSLMPGEDFRVASEPLFAAGEVDVVEWSFDTAWGALLPSWLEDVLKRYSAQEELLGHGVSYSPLSAQWSRREDDWLRLLQLERSRRAYVQISEHFGFCRGGDFHQAAPLPVPRTTAALQVGRERLKHLRFTAQCPVGLENLAFAFGRADVAEQGEFLEALLEPVDGFLLLDLHNLYCHGHNFEIAPVELLPLYPLRRVRELHVSGGSWSRSSRTGDTRPIRRDTHDGAVPEEVFELTAAALRFCPNVTHVIFERMGGTLVSEEVEGWRADFRKLREIVEGPRAETLVAGLVETSAPPWGDGDQLRRFQELLLDALWEAETAGEVLARLRADSRTEPFRDYVGSFEPRMVEVAMELTRKWGRR